MTITVCKECQDRLPALLEASREDASLDAVRAHVAGCAACQAALSRLQALGELLLDAGISFRNALPSVDFVEAVLSGVDDLKAGRRFLDGEEDPLSIDVIYALDGEQDDLRRARFEKSLRQHPALQKEFDDLQALHENLQASAQDALPEVDLVDGVMGRLSERKAQEAAQGFTQQARADLNAYMEDALDAAGFDRLESAAETYPALSDEFNRRRTLKRDLEHVGDALRARLPQVDLVAPVMTSVKIAAASGAMVAFRARPKLVHTAPAPKSRQFSFKYVAGLAAAALLMAGAGFLLFRASETVNRSNSTVAKIEPIKPAVKLPGPQHTGPVESRPIEVVRPVSIPPLMPPAPAAPPTPKTPKPQGLTLQDAINARRLAMKDDADSLTKLAQWASLTPDEARELLKQSGLSPEAVLGATQFLPPNEAIAVLRAAMANNPNDPYLNYALAKAFGADPDRTAESAEQLAQWSAKDQSNGLPQFMLARAQFSEGNNEAALNTLTQASALSTANDYGVRTARQQRDALIASGMDPGTASYLAASLAGNQQYENLTQMGHDLIQQGKYYESIGETDTAQQIYQSVQQMGAQLVAGASLSGEQLAGYQVQLDAVDALKQIYALLEQPDNIQLLQGAYQGIKDGVGQTLDFVGQLGGFILGLPPRLAIDVANQILQGGDLSVNTHSSPAGN